MRKRSASVEDETPAVSEKATLTTSRGWGSFNKAKEAVSKSFGEAIKWTDNEEVILRFLEDSPYASYQEHWLKEITEGRKSFVCLGDECPLCEYGDVPNRFQALFNVVVLDEDGKGSVKIWKASAGPAGEIEKRALAKATQPLNKADLYFVVKRFKEKNNFYKYTVDPVKARDLVEDYEVSPLTQAELDDLAKKVYDETSVTLDSVKELREIAREYLTD